MNHETIDVICIVFPDGVTYFRPAEGFQPEQARIAIDTWKASLSEDRQKLYMDAHAMGGFLWMHMLKEDYDRLQATNLSYDISTALEGA